MSDYKGVLHETAVRFPDTDIWMDSCGEEELDYGLARGIVGRCGAGDVVMCVFSHRDPGPWVNGCGCAHPGARGSAGMGKGQLKG